VPEHDRALEPELGAERGDVVGRLGDVAAGDQVDRDDAVPGAEVLDLRLEERPRAAPAVDEDERWLAGADVVVL
jgi:hypothetical protein